MPIRCLTRLRHRPQRCVDMVRTRVSRWTKPFPLATGLAADVVRNRHDLVLENALLRQQLLALGRTGKRPTFTSLERGLLVLLASRLRSWASALLIIQPETVVR